MIVEKVWRTFALEWARRDGVESDSVLAVVARKVPRHVMQTGF